MPPPDCLIQRGSDCPVHMMSGTGRQPVLLHSRVEALQVLRLQTFEAVRADPWDQMFADVDLVPQVSVLRDVRRSGDVSLRHLPVVCVCPYGYRRHRERDRPVAP